MKKSGEKKKPVKAKATSKVKAKSDALITKDNFAAYCKKWGLKPEWLQNMILAVGTKVSNIEKLVSGKRPVPKLKRD